MKVLLIQVSLDGPFDPDSAKCYECPATFFCLSNYRGSDASRAYVDRALQEIVKYADDAVPGFDLRSYVKDVGLGALKAEMRIFSKDLQLLDDVMTELAEEDPEFVAVRDAYQTMIEEAGFRGYDLDIPRQFPDYPDLSGYGLFDDLPVQ